MRRELFTDDHEALRQLARDFVEKEIQPHYTDWEKASRMPREVFEKLGSLLHYANAEQRQRWFPGLAAGTLLTAIAMTEPGTGSDLAGIRTTAVRDGDEYILNGAKTFITGGLLADLVIVVARTSTDPDNRRRGLTLLVVEDGMPGFVKGRALEKMGCKVQDTAELSFTDVRVPVANRLGAEGEAFGYLGHNLPQERMTVAVGSVAQARAAVDATIEYVKGRKAFGTPVASFQNTKFELAAMAAEIEAAQAMLDRAIIETRRRPAVGCRCGEGEVVLHRDPGPRRRPLSAALRRLRLHDGVPDSAAVHGRPRRAHLCRDQRGDEGDHRQVTRTVTGSEKSSMRPLSQPANQPTVCSLGWLPLEESRAQRVRRIKRIWPKAL
jgi:alkylation response protein AidB-like acyl-CoA dehydrogenase